LACLSRRAALATVIFLAAIGCGFGADKTAGEAAVTSFHNQFNADAFLEIYAGSSAEFKKATREAEWIAFISAVKRKTGAFSSAKLAEVRLDPRHTSST
jgi:hypothetical protein